MKDDEDDEKTVLSCTGYAPRYPVYNCSNWPKCGTKIENKAIEPLVLPDIPRNDVISGVNANEKY